VECAVTLFVVNSDVTKAGVRNWRLEVEDRHGWRRIPKEAKAHFRAVVPLIMTMMKSLCDL
jgi:hypothetical protein